MAFPTLVYDTGLTVHSDQIPNATKDDNGDITLNVGSLGTVVDHGFSNALCPRGLIRRALVKRMTVRCLVNKIQAFLRLVQEGGDAQAFRYINPADFPEAKNELLIESLDQTRDFVDALYLGPDTEQEVRDNLHTWSNWMAFGEAAGNIVISDGKMRFSYSFLERQEAGDDEEDEDNTECPTGDYKTFCSNCGGNAIEDDRKTLVGECKGVSRISAL